ncbi:murein biosynthesis integral membrane protein MurJ [Kiloniella laminariae]|uniref:Probable lipid II flippase MurJ n=1 Tax=Kiloniella laminariae TaxID=454162 RepID=A0ABT4LJI9_9PROT|nr:murein biosynthesis integral membrane protein MurJ [Kiloniella laminariae]MCZ4281275.1 murein biosynthesis integral membrane protein MurJ [Kiloniella laminariae]
MSLGKNLTTVSGFTGLSRILGFVRDILIATSLGTGPVADAFFVAFRLPNLFRRLFAEGAFNAAFVPLYAGKIEAEGPEAAQTFAEQVHAVMFTFMLVLTLAAMVAMPWVTYWLAPGFEDWAINIATGEGFRVRAEGSDVLLTAPENFIPLLDYAEVLNNIAFPYLFFMVIVALFSGMLNSFGRFAEAAAAPVLLNIFFIISLIVIIPRVEDSGQALAWTVTSAGFGQLLLVYLALRKAGLHMKLRLPRLNSDVKTLMRRMVPGLFSAGAMQINVVIGTMISSYQESGVSFLYFADRVYQLPLGLIGIAFGVVLLPELSRKLKANDHDGAMRSMNQGMEMALLLTLPATIALVVIPWPIIVTLFEHGEFTRESTNATALALMAYAAGLPAYVLVKILQPAFYAREDTVTPFHLAIVSIVINIVLSLALFQVMQHVGIALATAISSWVNVLMLWIVLVRRGHLKLNARFVSRLPKILAASFVMGGGLWAGMRWLNPWFEGIHYEKIVALSILIGGGFLLYALLTVLFGIVRPADIARLFRRKKKA